MAWMEIVSEPDLRSPEEVLYVKKLRSILRCIGSCDGTGKGNLRADVNVSVKTRFRNGARCEIKTLIQ